MNARPYAAQMQRVLVSVAARVDPSIHPLLTVREPNTDSRTLVIVVTGDKGLCGSFNTNVIKAGAASFSGALRSVPSVWWDARAATSSDGAVSTCCSSRSGSSRSSATRTRSRLRRPRSRRLPAARSIAWCSSTTSSGPSCRSASSSISCCRSRERTSTRAPSADSGTAGRLPLRAVAAGDFQSAAAEIHRSAGVSRAARVERRVLRGADDGHGHGDQELRRHDRQPDAVHEQGPAGGDHARNHRSRFRAREAL